MKFDALEILVLTLATIICNINGFSLEKLSKVNEKVLVSQSSTTHVEHFRTTHLRKPTFKPPIIPTLNTPNKQAPISPNQAAGTVPVYHNMQFETLSDDLPSLIPTPIPSGPIPTPEPSFLEPTQAPVTEKPLTFRPTRVPTQSPGATRSPTAPSMKPTTAPSVLPTRIPSLIPTVLSSSSVPSVAPSPRPTSSEPSTIPSFVPTSQVPSVIPTTTSPSVVPTLLPSTSTPTAPLSCEPSVSPSVRPSTVPSAAPSTDKPSFVPSFTPTSNAPSLPSVSPSTVPTTSAQSEVPSLLPTTNRPSISPSVELTTIIPSNIPTMDPTIARPTESPSPRPIYFEPTEAPVSQRPNTDRPTRVPTEMPTETRSQVPTVTPSADSTSVPSLVPSSQIPSVIPTDTPSSSFDSAEPTAAPTVAATRRSAEPSTAPSIIIQVTATPSATPTTDSPTTETPVSSQPSSSQPSPAASESPTTGPTTLRPSSSSAPSETPSTVSSSTRAPSVATPTAPPSTGRPSVSPSLASFPVAVSFNSQFTIDSFDGAVAEDGSVQLDEGSRHTLEDSVATVLSVDKSSVTVTGVNTVASMSRARKFFKRLLSGAVVVRFVVQADTTTFPDVSGNTTALYNKLVNSLVTAATSGQLVIALHTFAAQYNSSLVYTTSITDIQSSVATYYVLKPSAGPSFAPSIPAAITIIYKTNNSVDLKNADTIGVIFCGVVLLLFILFCIFSNFCKAPSQLIGSGNGSGKLTEFNLVHRNRVHIDAESPHHNEYRADPAWMVTVPEAEVYDPYYYTQTKNKHNNNNKHKHTPKSTYNRDYNNHNTYNNNNNNNNNNHNNNNRPKLSYEEAKLVQNQRRIRNEDNNFETDEVDIYGFRKDRNNLHDELSDVDSFENQNKRQRQYNNSLNNSVTNSPARNDRADLSEVVIGRVERFDY